MHGDDYIMENRGSEPKAFTCPPLDAACQNDNCPAPSVSARSAMLVYVTVVNMFRENTMLTEANVTSAIHSAFEKNDTMVKSYFSQDLCDYYGCVKNDITKCQDGLQCPCKPGFEKQNPQVPFCVAVTCSEPCNAEDKKQCLKTDNGAMECVCMPGYQKANNNGKCEECPFGYSGMDCKDRESKNKKKNIEEQRLIEDDSHNLRRRQTGFSNLGADTSIFPKVRTGVPRQTSNAHANQRSMPHPDY
ncbi:mucin-13 [Mastomys coucha]|uniref:mucin-13 n=1 Tax=Mastomys coucha TaxID=35658 RepID=UPI0012625981|nr:mucin-13 [Mastomys coucha]